MPFLLDLMQQILQDVKTSHLHLSKAPATPTTRTTESNKSFMLGEFPIANSTANVPLDPTFIDLDCSRFFFPTVASRLIDGFGPAGLTTRKKKREENAPCGRGLTRGSRRSIQYFIYYQSKPSPFFPRLNNPQHVHFGTVCGFFSLPYT